MVELARMPRIARHAPLRVRQTKPHLRYMAFLSYSHDDEKDAAWLEESLETFRVPPRLVGQLTDMGPIPKKLTPIFRDRHELAAAADLGEEIEEAIAASRFLIVLCSKTAAQSHWINEEIALFKRLHEDDRVLAVILDGEPFASDDPERAADECFPQALRIRFDARGRPTSQRAEPLAADLRELGDGRRMGLLKTIAGMLGVGLDELAQREAHRRYRRMTIITAASVAGMLFTSGLAYTAIQARDEARDQRREADGLVGFMLGDLREKLEPIGRLDVLDSVGARALAYYEKQDKSDLSDEALAQRSKALTLMGQMAQARGDLDGALRRYREAMAGTSEAVRRSPDDPQRYFDHAQNVFWVGYIDYQRGNLDRAANAFREYRRLADRMLALDPNKPDYRLERIYADTNLGTVLMDQRHYRDAANLYQQLLEQGEALVAAHPENLDYQKQRSSALAWLADARENSGQLEEALANRERQLALLKQMWAAHPGDTWLKREELGTRRALTRLFASRGQMREAFEQASLNSGVLAALMKTEPNNMEWVQTGADASLDQAELYLAAGRTAEAEAAERTGCAAAEKLAERDPTVTNWRTSLQLKCTIVKTRIALHDGDAAEAQTQARQLLALTRAEPNPVRRALSTAVANFLLGVSLKAAGQTEAARGALQAAVDAWPKDIEETPQDLARKALLFDLASRDSGPIRRRLAAMGYRNPDYLKRVA
jgi:tetratricopeptide (TPR) repeat protein